MLKTSICLRFLAMTLFRPDQQKFESWRPDSYGVASLQNGRTADAVTVKERAITAVIL
jgi:hypothetical protein